MKVVGNKRRNAWFLPILQNSLSKSGMIVEFVSWRPIPQKKFCRSAILIQSGRTPIPVSWTLPPWDGDPTPPWHVLTPLGTPLGHPLPPITLSVSPVDWVIPTMGAGAQKGSRQDDAGLVSHNDVPAKNRIPTHPPGISPVGSTNVFQIMFRDPRPL